MNSVITRIGLILLMATTLGGCGHSQGWKVGNAIIPTEVTDIHGKTLRLPQDVEGKVVLLRFWSMDCLNCDKRVLLALDGLYKKYRDKGFMPIAIHEGDPDEENADILRLRQFGPVDYPMLADHDQRTARNFGVVGLPTTVIFDREGIVRERLVGEAEIADLEKLATHVLDNRGIYDTAH